MVTGIFLSANGSGAGGSAARAAIGNPLSGSQRRKRRGDERRRQTVLTALASLVLAVLIFAWLSLAGEAHGGHHLDGGSRERWEEGAPMENSAYAMRQRSTKRRKEVHPSSIDTVVRYLLQLASLKPSNLWDALGMEAQNYGDDPFSLRALEKGQCPWSSEATVPWLSPRPHNSDAIAEGYRKSLAASRRNRDARPEENGDEVAIWYEHLSKAGGTTFCGLAKSNMQQWQVPRYHCMPGKLDDRTGRKLLDGRVGTWSNDELMQYVADNGHRVVSNEWEPFSVEKLELSNRRLDGTRTTKHNKKEPRLLFVTTLRDPSDRLLSAFTFFGLTVTKGKRQGGGDPPTFHQWIANTQGRLGQYRPGSMNGPFRANTARYNHVVWRFSGGKLESAGKLSQENEWEGPFADAARALMQHDLVLPMDIMTKDGLGKEALSDLLGWTNFRIEGRQTGKGDREGGHVVTIGGIKNSNAREYFGKEEYRALWEANRLDHILYLWCRAVFLARLHCADVLAT